MKDIFKAFQGIGNELQKELSSGIFVWRGQSRIVYRASVRDGVLEDCGTTQLSGQGLQVWRADGASALASSDEFTPKAAHSLLTNATRILDSAPAMTTPSGEPELSTHHASIWPETVDAILACDPKEAGQLLLSWDKQWRLQHPDLTFRWTWRAEVEAWRIERNDGTQIEFAQPRVLVSIQVRAVSKQPVSIHESFFASDPYCLNQASVAETLTTRLKGACDFARAIPDAPQHPAGPTPLLMEYALAKGLAHEAFGHASEADGFRSSVLAENGQFKVGQRVSDSNISIIDEPVEADHAWQPYSQHGLKREPVHIVNNGALHEALCDPWTAHSSGHPPLGSARAESYRDAPLPRMTNIRLDVQGSQNLAGKFEDYSPQRVSQLLEDAGVFKRCSRVAYLTGYRGGQVNPTSGDFVFNCRAIWSLGGTKPELYKPAIFSGSMFGALESIAEAFGPLRLDALGYCGKWGQSVPSSGGGPWFVMMNQNSRVQLGGS